MLDYSKLLDADGRLVDVPMIRGYPWPAGGRAFTLRLANPDGWTPGVEDGWTWTLLFDLRKAGGAAALTADAAAAAIVGAGNIWLDLDFVVPADDSADAPGTGNATVFIDLMSDDGVADPSIWPEAHGSILVRSAVGGVV